MNAIDCTVEIWREVDGFKDYEVSNLGRVRSWRKRGPGSKRRETPVVMTQAIGSNGYCRVKLREPGKKPNTVDVHRLVAMLFLGTPELKHSQVRHLNGKRTDNTSSNIAWGTARENSDDKLLHGTMVMGEKTINAKMTNESVKDAVERYGRGESISSIAIVMGVSSRCIYYIVTGKTWSRHTGLSRRLLRQNAIKVG